MIFAMCVSVPSHVVQWMPMRLPATDDPSGAVHVTAPAGLSRTDLSVPRSWRVTT
jgi:hypothetical protein